ncbi:hypothetical protein KKC_00672 [Listeria fleischmannii subsp. coloradonensis]|nr:hypothetical protein KKC_00672 [Listeria fleischmannii subsp. coloradonensis]
MSRIGKKPIVKVLKVNLLKSLTQTLKLILKEAKLIFPVHLIIKLIVLFMVRLVQS